MSGEARPMGFSDLVEMDLGGASILVVDDDIRIRSGLSRLLGEMGHDVKVAASAEEADAWLARHTFDLALVDIELPRMNGVEFLSWSLRRAPDTPVIMITGRNDGDLALTCMKAGARTYLVKPLDSEFLKVAVRDALMVRWLLRQANAHRAG